VIFFDKMAGYWNSPTVKNKSNSMSEDTNKAKPESPILKERYVADHEERHQSIEHSGEANMINSYLPVKCPFCGVQEFRKSGHTRMQGYLNLFAFISNPPTELLEKVELVINLGFQNPKLLRYREFYGRNTCL
jgi:hypothetical protein